MLIAFAPKPGRTQSMGTAASSALRTDSAAGGPAYGSLEGLGGPRKLKKKPVLVLDADELEKAHAMFHEASAELLGEDVERAPRPAAILGLAPMVDDDPEEMGADDDVEDGAADDMPTPEDVLAMTSRKTSAPKQDALGAVLGDEKDESLDSLADMGSMGGMISPSIGGSIEDDIDLETRIFPSLPVQPELAEENEQPAPIAPVEQAAPAPEPEPQPIASEAAEPEITEPEVPDFAADMATVPHWDDEIAPEADETGAEPVHSAEPEGPQSAPTDPIDSWTVTPIQQSVSIDPATHFPFAPTHTPEPEPEPEPQWEAEPTSEMEPLPEAAPEPSFETEPEPEPKQHSEAAFLPELPPEPEPDLPPAPGFDLSRTTETQPSEPRPDQLGDAIWDEYDPDAEAAANADVSPETAKRPMANMGPDDSHFGDSDYTVTQEDHVDGYAFMRDQRSRRSAVMAAQEGRQSGLRAKLLREAEEKAAKAENSQGSRSLFAGLWNWLSSLFQRRG